MHCSASPGCIYTICIYGTVWVCGTVGFTAQLGLRHSWLYGTDAYGTNGIMAQLGVYVWVYSVQSAPPLTEAKGI